MIVDPFWAGVFSVIFIEMTALIIAAIVKSKLGRR